MTKGEMMEKMEKKDKKTNRTLSLTDDCMKRLEKLSDLLFGCKNISMVVEYLTKKEADKKRIKINGVKND